MTERNRVSKDEINYILDKYASSKNTEGQTRRYSELLGGRFRLTKVVRIDHKDYDNDLADTVTKLYQLRWLCIYINLGSVIP
ncbi:MAG TPA: hypothetical protein VKA95_04720 [Nitrososphaeraceae archaeon]|jgi:calcineurin-like phosphoesterase family protein|nr:hypothetical protein [Nitrososphaeraceae archaeon]